MSEAIMPNTRYQQMANKENHALFLVEHDKRLDDIETVIPEIKKDSGLAFSSAGHAEDVSRDTQLKCRGDLAVMKSEIEGIKDKISGLASEHSVQILTNTIVTDKAAKQAEQDEKDRRKNRLNTVVVACVMGLFTLAGIWFKGEVEKTNAMFLKQIESTIKQTGP